MAYWVANETFEAFTQEHLVDHYTIRNGISTGDNERYLRLWHEVDYTREYWKPCNKGGSYRKWYGNNEYYVYWKDNGMSIRTSLDDKGRIKARLGGIEFSFWQGIEMSRITSGSLSFRISEGGFIYESSTNDIYQSDDDWDLLTVLGYCNTKVVSYFLNLMNPTINIMPEDLRKLPCPLLNKKIITDFVLDNIQLSREDWDSFEKSWDYKRHPLICKTTIIENSFKQWQMECDNRFNQMKSNEEKLNDIFIDFYGLQDELTSEVEDKDVTVRKADLSRDIRSFISYAVGCMFGRYSLDKEGLIYAGGEWDSNRYKTFLPDDDNCIPITDEEYFSDDIVTRFAEFVKTVYGADTLEENLNFIANALDNKGDTSREVIRNYFLKDFYADHLKIYQKRPIYWLFDSGKQNGFKALIYMHRYDADTVGRVRTDYLHRAQKYVETAIQSAQYTIDNASSASEKSKATKAVTKYTKQLAEMKIYDEAIAHIANKRIEIDLDDGVKVNYEKFQGVEVAQEGKKALKVDLLAKLK